MPSSPFPFWLCIWIIAVSLVAGAQSAGQSIDAENAAITESQTQNVLQASSGDHPSIKQVVVTHISTLTVLEPASEPNSARHQEEKDRLLKRLQRNKGKWDSSHPRYRLLTALHGFYRYKERNLAEVERWRGLYKRMPKRQRSLIESSVKYTNKLNSVEHLFEKNEVLAHAIVHHALEFYNIEMSELENFIKEAEASSKQADKTSVNQAMKHFVRDWAEEGKHERNAAFPCILDALERMFPDRGERDGPVRVLLPGAGLGRIAHEIAGLGGFEVTTNEWSSYMNLAYRYLESLLLRHNTPNPNSANSATATFHPFIDWWSHHASTADLKRPITFPDSVPVPVNTSSSSSPSSVLLVEGDFTTIFSSPDDVGKYDAIITLFFIDTARNLLSYLETIHRLLRPGGTWINLGPLLYGSAPFLQLSLDEIVDVCERVVGLEFLDTDPACGALTLDGKEGKGKVRGREVPYGFNERGLTKNAYQAQFWVARRR
ncbi:hypothetical protein VTN00DRAFT_8215 [Thermoascus crustaceus]|uniref:uncharacterized protein n=1 Tax=Thermoascus crustaceus TaxID=5088 RepID=UPI0037421CAB